MRWEQSSDDYRSPHSLHVPIPKKQADHLRDECSPISASESLTSEPIAIIGSKALSHHPYTASANSSSSTAQCAASAWFAPHSGKPVDGPLHDLLPAFTVSPSSSSSGQESYPGKDDVLPEGRSLSHGKTIGFARRVVSAPINSGHHHAVHHSSSPRSPLSGGSDFSHSRRRSAQFPFSGTSLGSSPPASSFHQDSPYFSSSLHPFSTVKSHQRRRSSMSSSLTSSAPSIGSFVGSYENSLLTGRMSAPPSLPLPFLSSIGVLGSPDSPSKLRCPPHLNIPFGAFFYTGPDGSKSSSPYVGTIDLESHYMSLLEASNNHRSGNEEPSLGAGGSGPVNIPRFPGYQVPRKGQLQLIIKNPNSTAIKLFLVPYDLSGLERDGQGGKIFLRQKSYTVENIGSAGKDEVQEGTHKGKLRYAVHLQFCCPPASASLSSPSSGMDTPNYPSSPTMNLPGDRFKYYLHQTVRVVFASRALDSTEKLRVVAEGPDGMSHPHLPSDIAAQADKKSATELFSPYKGPGRDWEVARKKAKERERLRNKQILVEQSMRESGYSPNAQSQEKSFVDREYRQDAVAMVVDSSMEDADHDPDTISDSFEFSPSSYLRRPLLSTPPSPPIFSESHPLTSPTPFPDSLAAALVASTGGTHLPIASGSALADFPSSVTMPDLGASFVESTSPSGLAALHYQHHHHQHHHRHQSPHSRARSSFSLSFERAGSPEPLLPTMTIAEAVAVAPSFSRQGSWSALSGSKSGSRSSSPALPAVSSGTGMETDSTPAI